MSNPPTDPKPAETSTSSKFKLRGWPKWRRRLWRGFLVVLALAIVLRIVLFFAIAPVMRKVAGIYGFDVTFQRQELTLLGGDVGLWYLKVTPRAGGEPIFQADYIRGSISTIELMKGRLLVRRAEADGVNLTVERNAAGEIPVLDQVLSATASNSKPAVAIPAGEQTLDFTPPLKVEAFRLQHVRATIRDASVTPPVQATIAMDVRVSSLGQVDRPTEFDVDVWSESILDSMRITGQGTSAGRSLNAQASITMRGLHPAPLAGYIAAMGIRPSASSLNADLSATLKTEPVADSLAGIKAMVSLDRIRLTADEQDAAALTRLEIQADKISSAGATIAQITVDGGRLFASRSNQGALRALGFELGAPAAPTVSTTRPAPQIATLPSKPAVPFALAIKQINIRDAAASLTDFAVSPVNILRIVAPRLAIEGQSIDPSNPEAVIPLSGEVSLPGIAGATRISGTLKPFAATKSLQLEFEAAQIKPDAIRPYLSPLGLEALLENGTATGQLQASIQASNSTADLQLTGIKLVDGEPVISLDKAQLAGVGVDAATGRIKAASIELTGPSVDIARDAAGRLTVAKVRWDPSKVTSRSKSSVTVPTATAMTIDVAALPKLEIGSFIWHGLKLRLRDERTSPPSIIAIDDAGVELKDFIFDLTSAAPSKPGSLKAWLSSPQLAKQATIEGSVTPGQNSFSADVRLRGSGLETNILAPYLQPFGITPTLKDGSLQADAKVSLAQSGNAITASLDASQVSLADSAAELGGVDALHIDGLSIGQNGIDIKAIEIIKPRSAIAYEWDKAFSALGMRIALPETSHQYAGPTTAPTTSPAMLALPSIALHQLRVTDGSLKWSDRGFANAVETIGRATVELSELRLGSDQPAPAKFRTVLAASDAMDEMVIEGTLDPNPSALNVQANVAGKGIRAGALAAYLPPGVALTTKDGQIRATLDASLKRNPAGGSGARLTVSNVDWRDGQTSAKPLFAMQSLKVAAPRIDLPGNTIAIDEISTAGIETDVALNPDGSISAGGARIGGASASANPSTRPAPVPSTQPTEDVAALIAEARKPLPLVTLKTLDLNILRAGLTDLSRPAAAPVMLENLHVANSSPIELGGENAAGRPPVKIDVTGKLSPLADSFKVNATIAPFAQEPSIAIDIASAGIHGGGLTSVAPELKPFLNGAPLSDGRFKTQVQSHIKFDRKNLRDFDLSRGFVMDLAIDGTEFRPQADGPVLLGLESLRLEQAKIDPRTASLAAKSLEITRPIASAYRDADGIHVAGIVIPLDRFTSPTTAPSSAPSVAAAPPAPKPNDPTTRPAGEIRVDRLTLNGLDLRIEDRTVSPNVIVPLNGLDVEVRDLTTMALHEPRSIRFAAIVNADKVPIAIGKAPTTRDSSSGTQPASRPTDQRELFSQIVTSGQLSLYPKPGGYAKTSINGVELAAFEGFAALYGAQVHGGVFDGTVDLRFREDGTLDTKSKLIITDLQYAETSGGPLAKAFGSPADMIIAAIEAPDKSITVPVSVSIKNGELGGLGGAVLGATASVIGTAIASAPVKAVDTVTQFVGIGGIFSRKPKIPAPVVFELQPGSTYIDSTTQARLRALAEFVMKNKTAALKITHELGYEDVVAAKSRANLDAADALMLAGQLRQRKLTLSAERAQLAGDVRAQLVFASPAQSSQAVQQLRAIDQEIGETEQSMDLIYDLLRPGADRQVDRRTRAAGIELGATRGANVRSAILLTPGFGPNADRVNEFHAQFNPTDQHAGGLITVSIVGVTENKK